MTANSARAVICFLALFLLPFGGGSRSALAFVITSSENVSISAAVGSDTNTATGGGSVYIPKTMVRFSGFAYPGGSVTLLEGGKERATVQADKAGYFTMTLEENARNPAFFTLFATDISGNRSLLVNYPLSVYSGYLTHISGITFAPTIVLDKTEARPGSFMSVTGSSVPKKNLEIIFSGNEKKIFTLISSEDGSYQLVLPVDFPKGDYSVSARYAGDSRMSALVRFVVGDADIPSADAVAAIPGDCNADQTINLIDFSILAFWYGKKSPPPCVDTSGDGKIDLKDFSILAFWWTG